MAPLLVEPFDRYPLQFVSVNEHRTAYIRHGDGPPAVLLHGYAGAIWNWEHQIEPLGRRLTIYIPDVLGQGLSDKPKTAYTPALYVEWLRGFLKAVGLERAALIGHSMGAGLALGLALTHPDCVDRLILISGFPKGVLDHVHGPYLRFFARAGSGLLFGLAYCLLGRRHFRKFLSGIVWDRSLITPAVVERAYRLRKQYGRSQPLWSSLKHVEEWETHYASRLTSVTAPTLLVWGRDDPFLPQSAGETLHRTIPGSHLVVLPDTGHLPMWERPDAVNRFILEFLTLS
ncbi:MAG: alpha/beta fold hydrolase [Nitrospirae bacterium]|nr:MAG: alpha/beta fold hydrolase [Nitrospirota bacterium]